MRAEQALQASQETQALLAAQARLERQLILDQLALPASPVLKVKEDRLGGLDLWASQAPTALQVEQVLLDHRAIVV